MKHSKKITIVILAMFLVTQFIGLYVVNHFQQDNELPYNMEIPESQKTEYTPNFISIIVAFVIAISLLLL